jgi:hypothetical protein
MKVQRVYTIARLQDGLITRAQALAAGATPSMIRHALKRDGPWQVILPGIYATFSGPLNWIHQLRAAVLHGGEGCMVTGPANCETHGLRYGPAAMGNIDVLVDEHCKVRNSGFVRVHRTTRLPTTHWWIDTNSAAVQDSLPPWHVVIDELAPTARPGQIPVAPTARALVDAVRWMKLQSPLETLPERLRPVRALLCEAVQRGVCSVDEIGAELCTTPRPGTALIRKAVADVIAGCRSAPECDLRDTIRRSRILPEPRWNQPLPEFERIKPDACWPEARLVVEVDSVAWHRHGDRYEATEKRRALYARLGWRVIPVSPFRLRTEPREIQREIEQAYQAGLR